MSYRVLWAPDAEHQLEELLRDSTSQASIAAAARDIDRHLLAAPLAFGESRFEGVRIGFAFPLGVHFEVLDERPNRHCLRRLAHRCEWALRPRPTKPPAPPADSYER